MINERTLKKASDVEWIGEIPNHWEVWKASHGFNLIGSGTTPKTDNIEYYDGDICWVTTSELRETVIFDTSTKLTAMALRDYSSLHKYPVGTLLIAMYGATIGRLGILGVEATVNQACCAFADSEIFDTKFLYYWLIYRRPILISLSSGGGQPNLNQEELRALKIPIPPLEEQRTIATMLDRETARLDELITEKERLLALLAEKRRALITNAVTRGLNPNAPLVDSGVEWLGEIPRHWLAKRLKYVATVSPPSSHKFDKSSLEEVVFLPMEKVSENGKINQELKKKIEEISAGFTYFEKNDVIVAKITPCFENGKGALLKELETDFGFGSTEFHTLRSNNLILPEFLFMVTRTDSFMTNGEASMTGAAGQKRVPTEFIQNFSIGLPPLEEQQKIVEYIESETGKIDSLQTATAETIELLKERRSSLIAAAVTGKISVRKTE